MVYLTLKLSVSVTFRTQILKYEFSLTVSGKVANVCKMSLWPRVWKEDRIKTPREEEKQCVFVCMETLGCNISRHNASTEQHII